MKVAFLIANVFKIGIILPNSNTRPAVEDWGPVVCCNNGLADQGGREPQWKEVSCLGGLFSTQVEFK